MQTELKSPALQLVFNTLILLSLIFTLLLAQTNLLYRLHRLESTENQPSVFVFNLVRPAGKPFFRPQKTQTQMKKITLHLLRQNGHAILAKKPHQ